MEWNLVEHKKLKVTNSSERLFNPESSDQGKKWHEKIFTMVIEAPINPKFVS